MAPPTAENMLPQLGCQRKFHPTEEVATVETTQLEVLEAIDETSDITDSNNTLLSKEAYTEKSSQISPEGPQDCRTPTLCGHRPCR
jgi:hypothetical protein